MMTSYEKPTEDSYSDEYHGDPHEPMGFGGSVFLSSKHMGGIEVGWARGQIMLEERRSRRMIPSDIVPVVACSTTDSNCLPLVPDPDRGRLWAVIFHWNPTSMILQHGTKLLGRGTEFMSIAAACIGTINYPRSVVFEHVAVGIAPVPRMDEHDVEFNRRAVVKIQKPISLYPRIQARTAHGSLPNTRLPFLAVAHEHPSGTLSYMSMMVIPHCLETLKFYIRIHPTFYVRRHSHPAPRNTIMYSHSTIETQRDCEEVNAYTVALDRNVRPDFDASDILFWVENTPEHGLRAAPDNLLVDCEL